MVYLLYVLLFLLCQSNTLKMGHLYLYVTDEFRVRFRVETFLLTNEEFYLSFDEISVVIFATNRGWNDQIGEHLQIYPKFIWKYHCFAEIK